MYELKQAPRAWNSKLDQSLVSLGSKRCPLKHTVYTKPYNESNLQVSSDMTDNVDNRKSTSAREVQNVSRKFDNQVATSLCKNPVHHERSKHIDTRFRYIRECIEEGMIEVQHVNTKDQLADILTNSLDKQTFFEMRKKVRVQKVKATQPD